MRTITFNLAPVNEVVWKDISSKIYYVKNAVENVEINGGVLEVTFQEEKIEESSLRDEIEKIINKLSKGSKKLVKKVIYENKRNNFETNEDPNDLLEELGVKMEGKGVYAFGSLFTLLMEYFDSEFKKIATSFSASQYQFPTLIDSRILARAQYFRSFPHSLSLVYHLKEDLQEIEKFSKCSCSDNGVVNADTNSLSELNNFLSPSVCFHLYNFLENKVLERKHIGTAIGKCFRYESGNMVGLERLWDFSMREIMCVGKLEEIIEFREMSIEKVKKLFNEIGLSYSIENANDPFFIGDFTQQSIFQYSFDLKYEIQMEIPAKKKAISVGSFNFHQDFFGKSFNIIAGYGEQREDNHANTGCTAFGVERCAYAFLSQFGLDMTKWPEKIRKAIKK